MQYKNSRGWIVFSDLNIPDEGGCQIQYFSEDFSRWLPACIFPSLDEQELFEKSNYQDWARGTTFEGTVMKYMMTDENLYWNYFISFKGIDIPGRARIKITTFQKSGRNPNVFEKEIIIDSGNTVFINNWLDWLGDKIAVFARSEESRTNKDHLGAAKDAPEGWVVDYHRAGELYLTNYGKKRNKPIYYNPGITGEYDLYLCFKEDKLELKLELPGMKHLEKVHVDERMIPAYKWWKEIYIGAYEFNAKAVIGIHKPAACAVNPLHLFGDLFYIKLVPVDKRKKTKKITRKTEIVFYSEPYSIAYFGDLQDEPMANALVEEYCSLGCDKIICQVGRGGSAVNYKSNIVKNARTGPMTGDDHQESFGVSEMNESMDVLSVLSKLCKAKGIKFIANIGLNVCYRGSNNESEFSFRHPKFHHPKFIDFLDFGIPEVREYVAAMLEEIASYDIDGISIDHMRYSYGQTVETIIKFHRLAVEKIGRKRRDELEINIRFPVDNHIYYEALQTLMNENLIDNIIPSRQSSIYPTMEIDDYVLLARKFGKKVYGCMDFTTYIHTKSFAVPRPDEFEKTADHYLSQGANGLFFYQSEQILENVFQRKWLNNTKVIL